MRNHYLGDAKAAEIAAEWGFSDVAAMGAQTGYYYWIYPQIPTLRPWQFTNDQNSERVILPRNPFLYTSYGNSCIIILCFITKDRLI